MNEELIRQCVDEAINPEDYPAEGGYRTAQDGCAFAIRLYHARAVEPLVEVMRQIEIAGHGGFLTAELAGDMATKALAAFGDVSAQKAHTPTLAPEVRALVGAAEEYMAADGEVDATVCNPLFAKRSDLDARDAAVERKRRAFGQLRAALAAFQQPDRAADNLKLANDAAAVLRESEQDRERLKQELAALRANVAPLVEAAKDAETYIHNWQQSPTWRRTVLGKLAKSLAAFGKGEEEQ